MADAIRTVAIFNASDDTVELLKVLLDSREVDSVKSARWTSSRLWGRNGPMRSSGTSPRL
jgi:hypothetical protein